jgi:hypothetical protein
MLETSIEELGCKRPISWKWGYKGDVLLPFVKTLMPFRVLKFNNKLLESANSNIQNCQ